MRRILLIAVCALASCGPALRGPGSFSDRLSRAQQAYLSDGDLDKAQSELEAALAADPTSPEAHFLLGDLLDVTGRPAQALKHYLRVLEEKPLLIWGSVPPDDVEFLLEQLPHEGLAINAIVDTPEDARALWQRCMT